MFLQFEQVLGSIKMRFSTMSTACGRLSGTFRQCQQLADDRRERFDKFDRLRTTVWKISTNSTDFGRPSGRFRQIRRLADDCRENFDNVEAGMKFEENDDIKIKFKTGDDE
jgi:hypothetical protein